MQEKKFFSFHAWTKHGFGTDPAMQLDDNPNTATLSPTTRADLCFILAVKNSLCLTNTETLVRACKRRNAA